MYYIDKIRIIRKQKKYSQKDMAELLQTTQQQYSKYEKNQQELPIRHLITICNHFQISADWLLELDINTQKPEHEIVTPNFDNLIVNHYNANTGLSYYHKMEAFEPKEEKEG